MLDFDYSILMCPISGEDLILKDKNDIQFSAIFLEQSRIKPELFNQGFINQSGEYFFPIIEDVLILLPQYAIPLNENANSISKMHFDKSRVFEYYNNINYHTLNNLNVQNDSSKWVDYREVSKEYIVNSLSNTKKHIPISGKYFLDIASGTVGFKEYVELSDNYNTRICIDISLQALLLAKENLSNKDCIFICGDITNIPIKENVCDVVVSHHTLYHVPANEQKTAVEEMYRVAKQNSKVLIVYCWFYHSWFMNLTLLPVQLYRIARHFAGKLYVRLIDSKTPRLYFYPHSRKWFKTEFTFSKQIKIYSWRSANKYFLDIYIHKGLWGKSILKNLQKSEDRYPEFWGGLGEYSTIVIEKAES